MPVDWGIHYANKYNIKNTTQNLFFRPKNLKRVGINLKFWRPTNLSTLMRECIMSRVTFNLEICSIFKKITVLGSWYPSLVTYLKHINLS